MRALLPICLVCLAALPKTLQASPAASLPFLRGADVSTLAREETDGVTYSDGTNTASLLTILKKHGYNLIRLRLFHQPNGKRWVFNDLAYTTALAQRVKKDGFLFLLDIHYSDTWADPAHQHPPAAWANLPIDAFAARLQKYTANVITALRRANAMPDMVQIGNEITNGMDRPLGANTTPQGWNNLGKMLRAGVRGVKQGAGSAPMPLIMIHSATGGDWHASHWFYSNIKKQKVPFDVIGLSYYPFWHGTLAQLKTNLAHLSAHYRKPIVVVETGYPRTTLRGKITRPDALQWPQTPDGQKQFLLALLHTVQTAPDQLGRGVVYWEPAWITDPKHFGSWNAYALFNRRGKALPGMAALGGK